MKFYLLIFISLGLKSCTTFLSQNDVSKKEDFCSNPYYAYDVMRLPLIYPFELVSTTSKNDFFINSGDALSDKFDISGSVDSIYINDSLMVLKLRNTNSDLKDYILIQNVEIPSELNSQEFNEQRFLKKIKLKATEQIYIEFLKTGRLPWNCMK